MKNRTRWKQNLWILCTLLVCVWIQTLHITKESALWVILSSVHPFYMQQEESVEDGIARLMLSQVSGLFPVYDQPVFEMQLSDALTWEALIMARSESGDGGKWPTTSESGDGGKWHDGNSDTTEVDITQNGKNTSVSENAENEEKTDCNVSDNGKTVDITHDTDQSQDEKRLQNEEPSQNDEETLFFASEAEKYAYYESLKDYDTLVKEFYQIDQTTYIGAEELDGQKLLAKDLTLKQTKDQPQILIYHTHATEAYADSREGAIEDTVTGMGELLAKELTAMGYNVIHDTTKYDEKSRDDAYARAAVGLKDDLEKYPSIEVVIDLHRDGVAGGTRLAAQMDGKSCAKFMFFNGLCRTRKTGMLERLPNPNLSDNLAFSFQMQLKAKEICPNLMRKIYLKGMRYNMHFRPKSLLIELGAQTNQVAEAQNSIPYIARLLKLVLEGE